MGTKPVYVTFSQLANNQALATITMNSPKANTFDYSSFVALSDALAEVEAAPNVRGLVLQSGLDNIFSAGFNFPIFHNISRDEFLRLWVLGKQIYRRIHAMPVPSIAAVNGHALGMGCVFALAFQSRFMVAGRSTIGLNEVAVGMSVPEWLAARYRDLTSPRTAEKMLPLGRTLTAQQAKEAGLVDEVFETKEQMQAAIVSHIEAAAKFQPQAQADTYRSLRRAHLKLFDESFEADNAWCWAMVNNPATQQGLAEALSRLKSKPKK
ncbi:ClpP/crotonase [Linderina pennispora]|uniref:ClpP/crotonase n=1 Tax=Linderina pennispora TaxID=61395 RepID=A0A1Y1WM29_9FUNG|nr:ClpP/crotonase [Linderina pennispora]ORX74256.1 ClpP/crotonase [Linderina pennispora]